MKPIKILIPQELFTPAENVHYEEDYDIGTIEIGPDQYTFAAPVHWEADITNTGEALLVTGTVEGDAQGACARCLEDANIHVKGQIEGYFLIKSDGEVPEDLDEDEYQVLSDDKVIDMAPLVEAAIILELPLIPLCKEDCLGLCQKCGANLNEGDCGCEDEDDEADPSNPFAALKDYRFN